MGFLAVEEKALYDFTVRFASTRPKKRRLDAIARLKALDPRYDAAIAEARVLYDAGERDAALEILEKASSAGRSDETLDGFIGFLRQ